MTFTNDLYNIFQVYSGEYRLRPEFIESTYYLYKVTKDPYYLNVGKQTLKSLQTHAREKCGFAALKVRINYSSSLNEVMLPYY